MIWLWVRHDSAAQTAGGAKASLEAARRSQGAHPARVPSTVHMRMGRMQTAWQMTMLTCRERGRETLDSWSFLKLPRDSIHLPIEVEKPPPNLDGSNGFMMSPTPPPSPKCPPRGMQPPPPFFFFDLDDSFRLRVWIPSFFIVNGRFTCNKK